MRVMYACYRLINNPVGGKSPSTDNSGMKPPRIGYIALTAVNFDKKLCYNKKKIQSNRQYHEIPKDSCNLENHYTYHNRLKNNN